MGPTWVLSAPDGPHVSPRNLAITVHCKWCYNGTWMSLWWWQMILRLWPWLDIMMTSSNGNIFRATGHLCGEFTVPGEFPAQRPVTRSFDVLFDLRLNTRLSKQSWGWWFETLSRQLWRHRNVMIKYQQSRQGHLDHRHYCCELANRIKLYVIPILSPISWYFCWA